eukprot:363446-Chlamydomonas_euryale.AAC.6
MPKKVLEGRFKVSIACYCDSWRRFQLIAIESLEEGSLWPSASPAPCVTVISFQFAAMASPHAEAAVCRSLLCVCIIGRLHTCRKSAGMPQQLQSHHPCAC